MNTELTHWELRRIFLLYDPCPLLNTESGLQHMPRLESYSSLTNLPHPFKLVVTPWADLINGNAVEACSIIAPLLRAPDTIVTRITVGSKICTVEYIYKTIGRGEISIMKTAKVSFRYDKIGDEKLWQYLLSKKYPVPLFFGVNHPLNNETVISLGVGVY